MKAVVIEAPGRLAIIDHGQVLITGTSEQIKSASGAATVLTVDFDGPATPVAAVADGFNGVEVVDTDGGHLRMRASRPDGVLAELIRAGAQAGLTVREAAAMPPSLQTAFLSLTGRDYQS